MNRHVRLLVFALAFFVAASGCSRCSKEGARGGPAASGLAPVPAPPGLIAEVVLPAPEGTWTKARGIIGGQAAFLPQSFGGLVATLLGLPMTVAGEIDGNVPVVGAVAESTPQNPPRAVVAAHVKAGDRFVDQLTKGEGARFVAKPDGASLVSLLEPKADKAGAPYALGVLANYLLIGRTPEDITALGPYVVRTLPTKPPAPKEDLTIDMSEAALSGPVQTILKGFSADIERLAQKSGAPAGGPAAAMLAQATAVLSDSAKVHAGIVIDATFVRARVEVVPKAGGGLAATTTKNLATGSASRLLELPRDVFVGATWFDSSATRVAQSATYAAAIAALLGKGIGEPERQALQSALALLGEARGDWMAVGLTMDPTGFNGFARVAIVDRDKAQQAMKALAKATELPAMKASLKQANVVLTPGKAKVEGVAGEVQRIRIDTSAASPGDKNQPVKVPSAFPSTIDLLYTVGTELILVIGNDATAALPRVLEAPSKGHLGEIGAIKEAVSALDKGTAFALVLDPAKIASAPGGESTPAPVIFAVGKDETPSQLWLRLDVATVAIQDIARSRGL